MNELLIIKYLLDINKYKEYKEYINIKFIKETYVELYYIYQCLFSLFEKTERSVSLPELHAYFNSCYPDADPAVYNMLFKRIDEEAIGGDVAELLLKDLKVRQQALLLAEQALSVHQGKAKPESLSPFIESINSAEAAKDDFSPVTLDLEELLNGTYAKPGLRWRLACLNLSLGSLRKGDFGFLFARPESYSRDTEVLTPAGWLTVDKVTTNTEIAQVDSSLALSFVYPSAVHPHEQEYCYHIHDTKGRVDLIVTEGHGMVVEKEGKLYKERADTVMYYQGIKHHVSAKTQAQSRPLSDMERLAIAYQADGHKRNYKEYGYTFSFKKQRKIYRLKETLDRLGWEYTTYKDGNRGHTGFYVKALRPLIKDFSWVDLDCKSAEWCQQFIEELSYWDATRRTDQRFKFDTTSKDVADVVQAIAIMAGYNCLMSKFKDNRKDSFKDVYSLSIRTNYQPIDGQSIIKERIPFTDTTYCFEVPTGMLLVRRNGAVAVCGNTGKTTFLASEVSNFINQIKEDEGPAIWLNNEEDGKKVAIRVYQAYFGVPLDKLQSNFSYYRKLFLEATEGKFLMFDRATISKWDVERLVDRYSPSLLVYDQIDKITGFSADREDLVLGKKYQWARELAKNAHAAIGVCQADGTAENVRYLTMEHVANAKTAKQAEADWILGIGCVHEDAYAKTRFLNISKNKLFGDPDSKAEYKHGKFDVLINPMIARYEDFINYG